jgi:hypothetical protein
MSAPDDDELIIDGDGESPETAIKFRPCHIRTRVALELRFICQRYGKEGVDWEELIHMTSLDQQSVWSIELADRTQRRVYFDTSQTIYDEQ